MNSKLAPASISERATARRATGGSRAASVRNGSLWALTSCTRFSTRDIARQRGASSNIRSAQFMDVMIGFTAKSAQRTGICASKETWHLRNTCCLREDDQRKLKRTAALSAPEELLQYPTSGSCADQVEPSRSFSLNMLLPTNRIHRTSLEVVYNFLQWRISMNSTSQSPSRVQMTTWIVRKFQLVERCYRDLIFQILKKKLCMELFRKIPPQPRSLLMIEEQIGP